MKISNVLSTESEDNLYFVKYINTSIETSVETPLLCFVDKAKNKLYIDKHYLVDDCIEPDKCYIIRSKIRKHNFEDYYVGSKLVVICEVDTKEKTKTT